MTERVRWTPEEKERLFTLARPLLEANRDMPEIAALRAIQDAALEEDRRRNLVNKNAIPPDLYKRLADVRAKATGQITSVSVGEHNRVVEELQQALQKNETLNGTLLKQSEEIKSLRAELTAFRNQPKPPTEAEVVKTFLSEVIGRSMALARFEGVAPIRTGTTAERRTEPRHSPDPQPDPNKPRLKKVVVVGPIREQRNTLLNEFEGLLDLRIFASDEFRGRGPELAAHADKVVIWTKFVGHDSYNNVPRDKIVLQATFDGLKDDLTKIAVS